MSVRGTGWWTLDERQRAVLAAHVKGRVVHDLGAGNGSLAAVLVTFGAIKVWAVDRNKLRRSSRCPYRVVTKTFDRYRPRDPDVCVLSWPENRPCPGLVPLVGLFDRVVYLGSNVGGSACGSSDLFQHLLTRELLDYVPHRCNTLVVCGSVTGAVRRPTWEEAAGLDDRYAFVRPYCDTTLSVA